jgi:hypothetical protein|tara:strand:- start:1540 stop:1869 length:330 start_codon:yes stop_codon:yes gene_type:complete
MNKEEFLQAHTKICEEAHSLLKEKIRNYSGSGDVFTNFNRVQHLEICSTDTGILARIADKFGRLVTHVNTEGGLVGNETFHDSILDLINYLVFLYCNVSKNTWDITKEM